MQRLYTSSSVAFEAKSIAGKGPYRQSRRATSSRTLRLDYRVKMDESQCLLAGEVRHLLCDSAFAVRCDLPNALAMLCRAVSFDLAVDILRRTYVHSSSLLGGRPMVGLQTLDLAIGVRVPASQPTVSRQTVGPRFSLYWPSDATINDCPYS